MSAIPWGYPNVPSPSSSDDSIINPTSPAGVDGLATYLSARSRAAAGTVVPIWLIGDSNGAGSNGGTAGFVGGWRHGIERALLRTRMDFDFVGSTATLRELSDSGLCWHDCYAGEKIEDATAALTTRLAGCASVPAIVVHSLGTNNIVAGDSAATMLAKFQAWATALFAALPTAHAFVLPPIPLVDGTTTHATLAAWQAVRAAYIALLAAYVASDPRMTLLTSPDLVGGDLMTDGVHLTRSGQMAVGEVVADAIDRYLGPPFRQGPRLIRAFRQHKPKNSIYCATETTDGMSAASPNGYAAGAASFAFALDLYPTAIAAALRTIATFSTYGAKGSGFWLLTQTNGALAWYWDDPSVAVGGGSMALTRSLLVNKWHRIVCLAQLNGAASSAGVYVNGKLAGILSGLPAWNMATGAFTLGKEGAVFGVGVTGYYGRVRAFKGASLPRPGSMAALRAVLSDYYDDGPIVPGTCCAYHDLDGSLNDSVYGGRGLSLVGSAANAAPYPGGSPLRPWDFAADYP